MWHTDRGCHSFKIYIPISDAQISIFHFSRPITTPLTSELVARVHFDELFHRDFECCLTPLAENTHLPILWNREKNAWGKIYLYNTTTKNIGWVTYIRISRNGLLLIVCRRKNVWPFSLRISESRKCYVGGNSNNVKKITLMSHLMTLKFWISIEIKNVSDFIGE